MSGGRRVLVTGGAGFIGSHIADELVRRGHEVTIFDNLDPQVHPGGAPPAHLNPAARFIRGDVRDADALCGAVEGQDVVFHEAAAVSVGQSQHEVRKFVDVNCLGTANLIDAAIKGRSRVEKIILAASMSSYGEGLYSCASCGPVRPGQRRVEDLRKGLFEPRCPACRGNLFPLPIGESSTLQVNSVYSITKRDQEDLLLSFGRSSGVPVVSLRYFNTYGPRQSLSNPYNGVMAIFLGALMRGERPHIYEDGLQTRDFVHVRDVVEANMLAMEGERAAGRAVNVGRGEPRTILMVAEALAEMLGAAIRPFVSECFRDVDIRHCYADIGAARELLGWSPERGLSDGLRELVDWAREE